MTSNKQKVRENPKLKQTYKIREQTGGCQRGAGEEVEWNRWRGLSGAKFNLYNKSQI